MSCAGNRNSDSPEFTLLTIFRIQKTELNRFEFKIRKDILKQMKEEGLFNYPKIENIKVKCSKNIAYNLYEQRKAKKFVITPQEDGSPIVILPPSPERKRFAESWAKAAMSR